ncbi:pentatricopeptide repeat-containing protein At4g18520, chloroplastic [Diospyros lotus]|uniref:pentatricopeptide repeat-containing protein At4g18520, chloroplastic n=1 Tax=Diospyros lotus TaxID=55363 RepID=UPI002253D716|nr:pentatricopeptide repeat-containing protein At4g18520, chloroplastic [Diospyros lotus]
MPSPTIVIPQVTLFLPPPRPDIQPPRSSTQRKNFKTTVTKNFRRDFPQNLGSFSWVNPPSTTHFSDLLNSQEEAQTGFSSNPLINQLVHPNVLASRLQSCYSVEEVRKLHAIALKCFTSSVTYVDNNLISAYLRFGDLVCACKLFDEMSVRNVVSWTAILNGYLRFGLNDEALWFYKEFIGSGVRANCKTFVCLLNLCSRRLDYRLGQQVHACIIKGNSSNLVVDSAIVYFYARCGDLLSAVCAFDTMPNHDVVSWTTMISVCSQLGWTEEALSLFSRMLLEGFSPNEFTVCSVLKACGDKKALKFGKQLHAAVAKKVFKNDVFIGTSLVDMYAKCQEIADSRKVFDGMRKRNTVTWTSIIAGYACNGLGEQAISLFRIMRRRNIFVNNLTMVSVLKACGLVRCLQLGKEVHAQLIKNFTQSDIYIGSTLVWLYCKCNEYSAASKVLQLMAFKDVVSWTAMISGCAGLGHEYEALEFLKEMLGEGVEPNPFTYSSALKACAKLENIEQGRLIHSSVSKTPAFSNVFVGSALIFMYTKCGYISEAIQVFDSLPERNLVSWKAMIVGYAKNGLCQEALKLMYRMQAEGVAVDDYIRATVLTACGDIDWNKDPSTEHCLHST